MHFTLYGRGVRLMPCPLLVRKMMLFMRLTALLLVIGCMHVSAAGLSQKVTLSVQKGPLYEVISEIATQTGVSMFFDMEQLRHAPPVTIQLKEASLEEALKAVLRNQGFSYEVKEGTVIIRRQRALADSAVFYAPPPPDLIQVFVRVMDERGITLSGITVTIKGTKRSYVTDVSGLLLLHDVAPDAVLVLSSVGFEEQLVPVKGQQALAVKLKVKVYELGALEINTGMFSRKKESVTGAASVYSGQELKAVGNKNLLESLKILDPSFVKVENNLQGSNPNQMPTFEIRGRTSISTLNLNDQFNADPNQPLFILDGFESTLKTIYDLDMNRVASVTILKDAASTALYGSKAANGVVVVETKRPMPGKLQVNYGGNYSLDLPDLSSYNMMNAAEKLRYDELSGLFSASSNGYNAWRDEAIYIRRLAEVQRGVNTYWLSEPVQTGFTHNHSIQISGGNADLMMNGGVTYNRQNGVMKGSYRDNKGGNINLAYRRGLVNINNQLTLNGTTAVESPYGSFSDFASAIPYYRKRNEDGSVPRYLDTSYNGNFTANPLYNASLYSRNQTQTFNFRNITQAIVALSHSLRLNGSFMVGQDNSTALVFIPPDNAVFQTMPVSQKGSYQNTRQENTSYSANLMLTWSKVVGRHQFTASTRGDITQQSGNTVGFTAVGFPYGTDGSPAFAYGFAPYSTPVASNSTSRSVGFLGNVNYGYDQRFMVDLTYRLDGASVFGSSRVFKPFLSAGVAWNLHKEAFLKNIHWLDLLKVRGNMGFAGNENIGRFSSVSLYKFNSGNTNNFGQGLSLSSLGNPTLDWQKTFQESYGIDFSLMQNRIAGSIEYYHKKTDPLAVGANGTLPSSAGVDQNYVINLGYLTNRGWNVNLRVSPVYKLKERIIWTIGIMGSGNRSTYGGFANRLSELNKQEQASKGLSRYYDGYSPDDIWAVVSKGIDPATGAEIFQRKDGSYTFTYDPADIVRVGNSRPRVEGNINTSFTYKNLTFSTAVSYHIHAYVFNTALFDKVENPGSVSTNLDKRALYDRWQKPGDVSQFSAISHTSSGIMSSRFIQKETRFAGENISLGYRLPASWISSLRLQSLSVGLFLKDIFRIESILTERGIDYPYARTVSFNISASF